MSATAIYKKNRRKRVTFATTGAEDANRTRDIVVVCCARCKGSVLCLLASQLLLSPKRHATLPPFRGPRYVPLRLTRKKPKIDAFKRSAG